MSQLLKVQCFNVTRDGLGAGVQQDLPGMGARAAAEFAQLLLADDGR